MYLNQGISFFNVEMFPRLRQNVRRSLLSGNEVPDFKIF